MVRFMKIIVIVTFLSCGGEDEDYAHIKWKVGVDGWVKYPPAIGDDGNIYATDMEYLYAINPDGTLIWKFFPQPKNLLPNPNVIVEERNNFLFLPVIGPDGNIYVAGFTIFVDKDHFIVVLSYLYAITPSGEKSLVFAKLGEEMLSHPAIDSKGTIYISTLETVESCTLYAIGKNGALLWKSPFCSTGFSPVIGSNGTIYVEVGDHDLAAIDAFGKLLWWISLDDKGFCCRSTALAIGPEGRIYAGNYALHAVDPIGYVEWTFKPPQKGTISPPVVAQDGTIYVTNGNELYALSASGELKWTFRIKGHRLLSPMIVSDGTVYVGGWDQRIYAINPDGSLKWKVKLPDMIPLEGMTVAPNGTIYLGSQGYAGYGNHILAIQGSSPLAKTGWPKLGMDLKNTSQSVK